MKRKNTVDTRGLSLKVTQLFWGRRADGSPMTDKERRDTFVQLLGEWQQNVSANGFAINRKGCFCENHDSDLRRLIKTGRVVRHRVNGGGKTRTSFVRLA